MALQYKYTYTNMWKKELGTDKLKSVYKKGKVHGEEYWMFWILPIVVFSNAQMVAMLPVFNSQRCSKGMFKIIQFLKMTEEKKLSREHFE